MRYRCSFRKDQRTGSASLTVEAADPYSAALRAANKKREEDFDAIEVWNGEARVLTWIRPPDDPTWGK